MPEQCKRCGLYEAGEGEELCRICLLHEAKTKPYRKRLQFEEIEEAGRTVVVYAARDEDDV